MVERRDIARAITGGPGEDPDAAKRAVQWLTQKVRDLGGQPLLYAPGRSNYRHDPVLLPLSQRILTETWKTLNNARWSGGPVLAAWPSEERLALIDGDRRTTALCVLAWNPKDSAAWASAHDPQILSPGIGPSPAVQLDPVVEQGLMTLTRLVNHSNNLAGSMDRRDAVVVLRTLHEGGHRLDPDAIYAWALSNDWPGRGALRLKEMASEVGAGKRLRAGGDSPLRADSLQRWRQQAHDR